MTRTLTPASPTWHVRGLHLDAARKYFTPQWIHRLLEHMAELGLNELQLHVSENEGYRVPSAAHPAIVSAEHLTRTDLDAIMETGERLGVRIVPALDVPGHLEAVLRHYPHLCASHTPEGRRLLDYSQPEAVELVASLIDEVHEMIPSEAWSLGGDEAFDVNIDGPIAPRFPQLAAYAERECGEGAHILDGYVHFLGQVVNYLESLGIADIRVWNDVLYQSGTREALPSHVTVGYWTAWHPSYPSLERVVAAGHPIINYSDRDLYYVLCGPGHPYERRPTADSLANWTPRHFAPLSGGQSQDPSGPTPWLRGASMAVWCDEPECETEQQVWEGMMGPLAAFARALDS